MEQLTHETMPRFMEQLRTLVDGHRFTLRSIRGHSHTGVSMKELRLEDLPGGLKILSLDMGGVVQPFTSYFADSSSEPLVNDIQTVRVMYKFTPRSLETHLTFLSSDASWEGTMVITIED